MKKSKFNDWQTAECKPADEETGGGSNGKTRSTRMESRSGALSWWKKCKCLTC